MTFSDLVLDHFQAPRNVGRPAAFDAEAVEDNPVCGDRVHVWLQIQDDVICAMWWQAEGCAPAIAAASITSELVRGLSLHEAAALDASTIQASLGGLPARKAHAALLAASVVRRAVEDYRA